MREGREFLLVSEWEGGLREKQGGGGVQIKEILFCELSSQFASITSKNFFHGFSSATAFASSIPLNQIDNQDEHHRHYVDSKGGKPASTHRMSTF